MTRPQICPHCRSEYVLGEQSCAAARCRSLGLALVPSRLGDVIDGRYEIVSILGAGSMSTVWLGIHQHTGQSAAIKVIERTVGEAQQAWLHELRATARAASAHSAEVFEAGVLRDGRFYIAMEVVEGQSLEDIMQAYHRGRALLPLRSVIHVGAQVCSALACAHRIGVVHQDLKPSNIVIVERPEDPEFVKVLDFGVARLRAADREHSLTHANEAVGTAAYIAPEQLSAGASVDARADLYSLGVVLFEALSGELPFQGDTPEALAEARLRIHPPAMGTKRPDLSPSLCRLVDQLLERSPAARPESADQVRTSLASALRSPSLVLDLRQGLPRPQPKPGLLRRLLGGRF